MYEGLGYVHCFAITKSIAVNTIGCLAPEEILRGGTERSKGRRTCAFNNYFQIPFRRVMEFTFAPLFSDRVFFLTRLAAEYNDICQSDIRHVIRVQFARL